MLFPMFIKCLQHHVFFKVSQALFPGCLFFERIAFDQLRHDAIGKLFLGDIRIGFEPALYFKLFISQSF